VVLHLSHFVLDRLCSDIRRRIVGFVSAWRVSGVPASHSTEVSLGSQAVIHALQQRYRRFWRPSTPSIVGEAPSRATKPTTVVGYIIIIPVQASDPFAVALLERFGECGFRCFVACAVTRNDPDRAYTLN
jgi:hypothetical protein